MSFIHTYNMYYFSCINIKSWYYMFWTITSYCIVIHYFTSPWKRWAKFLMFIHCFISRKELSLKPSQCSCIVQFVQFITYAMSLTHPPSMGSSIVPFLAQLPQIDFLPSNLSQKLGQLALGFIHCPITLDHSLPYFVKNLGQLPWVHPLFDFYFHIFQFCGKTF